MTAQAEAAPAGAGAQQSPWWVVLIGGIAGIIIGILLITNTAPTTVFLVQVLGIYWLISGIVSIVQIFIDSSQWGWKLVIGILGIIAGLLIIQHPIYSPLVVGSVAVIILGIQGLIVGIVYLIQAFTGGGWGIGVLGVLSIIFGVFLLANVWLATLALPWVFGFLAIVVGIVAVVRAFQLR
ncbi:MAG: DUF308 domain-containing protein [Anaerolineales bacterium]|nr:DUF308 domain-containing protein [Anaerolineales bacterium]